MIAPKEWKLRLVARAVYQTLLELANGATSVTVSNRDIAQRGGLCVRTVQRVLKELAGTGVIHIIPTPAGPSRFELGPMTNSHPLTRSHAPHDSESPHDRQSPLPRPVQAELTSIIPSVSAEDIYRAYPRRVARTDAVAAISKVLKAKKLTADELLQKTQQFAEAVSKWGEADRKFIPHPATWFNRGSYDDDPASWERNYTRQGQRPATTQEEHANGF